MVIGAFEIQRPQDTLKDFATPASIACHLAAIADPVRLFPIGVIRVETLFDGMGGETKHLPPHCRFQCFQIEPFQTLAPEQRFDIPQNLSRQQAVERGFF
jgi:hypothetical protein